MALTRKKDRRSPEKRALDAKLTAQRRWETCSTPTCREEVEVDGTINAITCWRCTAGSVLPPQALKPNVPVNKFAKYDFPRGWWLKVAFRGEYEGKTLFFNKGKEITKAEYKKLVT